MLAGFLKKQAVAVLCKAGEIYAVEGIGDYSNCSWGLLKFLPVPRVTSSQQAAMSYGSAVILSLS